ncbi:copper chaperone PCu(A)C [Vreelandella olivaria]|uniref:copper chaperone PCu(A)C n=1 Tax=Vreelandella olivaria TaxID=390919 RepID=UPI00201EC6F7|nr:copper chaperone PCu(A)C [Halomonas olivaria]
MFILRTVLLFSLLLISTSLFAHHGGSHEGDGSDGHGSLIEVSQPWIRATPPGAGAGGGFVTLTNRGDQDDRLVGATSSITERVEIHTMEMDGDVMRMAPLSGGIEIPAGSTVTLAPGGLHLMFMDLATPIVEGEPLLVTLEFQHADSIDIQLQVVPPGASPEGEEHHQDSHDHQEEAHGHTQH